MVLLRARDAAAVQASMAHPVASRVSDRLPLRGHIFEKSSSCSSLRWPTVLQLRMRPCRTWTSTWTAGASRQDPPTRSLHGQGSALQNQTEGQNDPKL